MGISIPRASKPLPPEDRIPRKAGSFAPDTQNRRLPEKRPPRQVEAPEPVVSVRILWGWFARSRSAPGHRSVDRRATAALRWAAARQVNKQAHTVISLRQSAERTSIE
ncbi:hypothetical protein GCM10007858_29660 [Bradyrhizobium liaoningense]|nr:hypothetical protein BEL01nite_72070 [Bradyrhizobium elkanii]GLR95331.1 hypothetical protein GCM10007858_29660 [Bradyrhizobium liaoningense]